MIFYFSGSGNSYSVAKQIAKKLDDELHSLALFNDFESCKDAERVGIVFPCYLGKAPDIVLEFKNKLFQYINKNDCYIYCVSTYAHSTATSYIDFDSNIHAWFEVKMPESDIVNSRAPKIEKKNQLILDAKVKVDGFTTDILSEKQIAISNRYIHGVLMKIVTPFIGKIYTDFSQKLYADDSCTKCKQCTKRCPLKNITFDETPVWGSNCANCMGCINKCPKYAIQYKKKTNGKERYIHPDYVKVYY